MQVKSYSKAELRDLYGISADLLNTWLKGIEHLIPYYKRTTKVFTPAQVKVVFEEFGVPEE